MINEKGNKNKGKSCPLLKITCFNKLLSGAVTLPPCDVIELLVETSYFTVSFISILISKMDMNSAVRRA